MSEAGHFQTSADATAMSAFRPLATKLKTSQEVVEATTANMIRL